MATAKRARRSARGASAKDEVLRKIETGIGGFDQVTGGGVPEGRTTILCGGAGCGKTLFSLQFLVRGALDHDEPGVFLAFEETERDIVKNVASLGFDLRDLERRRLLAIDHVAIERAQIEENGEYDLEGLFIRLGHAIDSIGAKRLVIDTLETVFGGLTNYGIIRSELRRLFGWLKDRGITTIVTAERGDGALTRHGLEEYVSDCVVLLDHRVTDQVSTRRLRIVKYRGSSHGSNEYPFLIDHDGITVVPITASELSYPVTRRFVTSGLPDLDQMLGGKGYYEGSTVLISGTAGSGKSSLAAHFAAGAAASGARALYVSYEESADQILRNMRSIGVDLAPHRASGKLVIEAHRPTSVGLEGHLALLHKLTRSVRPDVVVVDPIGTMISAGADADAHLMLVRLIDHLKSEGITTLLTSLNHGGQAAEATDTAISSIVDTWLLVRSLEQNGERTRGLYILKSRGMSHSNQIREFVITPKGIRLLVPYVGPAGVLTGTARAIQEAAERSAERERIAARKRTARLVARKRALLVQRIRELEAAHAADEAELLAEARALELAESERHAMTRRMGTMRGATGAREEGT